MLMPMQLRLETTALALTLTACSSSVSTRSDFEFPSFPSRSQLAELVSGEPRPTDAMRSSPGLLVETWELESPLPNRYDDTPQQLGGDVPPAVRGLFDGLTDLRSSWALGCFARQLERFIASKDQEPSRPLTNFMAQRCGWSSPGPGWKRYRWQGDELPPAIARDLARARTHGASRYGLWYERNAETNEHVLVLVFGRVKATLDPLSMVPTNGVVELRGEIGEREWISGLVTQGKFGANHCQVMPASSDRFRLLCPVDPNDRGAVIEVGVAEPGRFLGSTVLRVWVSPDRRLSSNYERLELYQDPAPIAPDAPLDFVFHETVNELREALIYGEIELASEQSEEFRWYHPYLAGAMERGDWARADTISRGLFAGWKLPGAVLDGDLGIFVFDRPEDRRDLMEAALASPGARYALLDPDRELLALSIDGSPTSSYSVLYATWERAPTGHQHGAEDDFSRRVELVRKLEGLPATVHVGGRLHEALAEQGVRLAAGRASPRQALNEALEEITASERARMRGLLLVTQDVHEIEVPDELLERDVLHLAVHVQVVKDPAGSWAREVLLLAYTYASEL